MASPEQDETTSRGALDFIRHEAAGGVFLLIAAVLALVSANTALAWLYAAFLDTPVVVQIGALKLSKPLLLWINDGLMAIFFFLVALEIKRELLTGELSSRDRALLPLIAAIGGMVMPAIVYIAINHKNPAALPGWAIPAATDIAFAVAVLALLGSRVPASLKVFLLALAIIDDLGAIIIIAVFYTDNLSILSLALAAMGGLALAALNYADVRRFAPYLIVGIFMWVCVLKSGVHATLAGVMLGFAIPLGNRDESDTSPLLRAEHALHPWVAFGIMPLFAFANAGVSFSGMSVSSLMDGITLGIALGLLIGKTVGITGAVWLANRLGIASLPQSSTWPQIVGVAMLGGIGFTMSLFIGTLAFPDGAAAAQVRLGVLCGSITAAVLGYILLSRVASNRKEALA